MKNKCIDDGCSSEDVGVALHLVGLPHTQTDKSRRIDPNDYKCCCFCCHVRTATICYAMWHVVIHVLFFVLLAVVLSHPNLMYNKNDGTRQSSPKSSYTILTGEKATSINTLNNNNKVFAMHELSNSGGDDDGRNYYTLYIRHHNWGVQDVKLALLITICTFMLSIMLLYGTVKNRPTYLMPFFCFQVLNLGISFVTLSTYFANIPDIKYYVTNNPNMPFRKQLLEMDVHWINLVFLFSCIVGIVVQAYLLNMVWCCYRYLVNRRALHDEISSYVVSDSEIQMPPDYDTVSKLPPDYMSAFQLSATLPPPPYQNQDQEERERTETNHSSQ